MRLFKFYDPGDAGGGNTLAAPAPVVSAPAPTASSTPSTPAGNSSASPSQDGANTGGGSGEVKVEQVIAPKVESKIEVKAEPIFDLDKWDSKLESLPDPYKNFASKYKSIVDKEWQPKIDEYESRLGAYKGLPDKTAYEALKKDLDLYRALSEGSEDPRIKEYSGRLENLKKSYEAEKLKAKQLHAAVEQYESEREQEHYRAFAEKNKNILSDPDKKKSLISLVESGLHEEAAVQLVSQPEDIVKEVRELISARELPESSHELAVEIVLSRHGIGPGRVGDDSPSAILTSGADGSYSSRAGYKNTDVRGLPLDQAREAATRAALKVVK